ncbi:MAG TPA: hypothetical protein VKX17_21895 [Planctomycetota bacterium]|nr:hypothetical protein [Planctomycetota bacterium]
MKKRSFLQKLFGGAKAEKAFEKRLNRIERNQQMILRLLQREAFKDSGILAPGFAATGLSVHSMQGEDGHILHILREIGVTNRTFVEIGIQNGLECNTANLTLNFGWGGVLIEGNPDDAALARRNYACFPNVTVKQAFVTKENVAALLKETNANLQADVFSLDIDGNDYWIWEALADFKPRLVVAEYNAAFGPERAVTIPYQADFCVGKGKPRLYFGASLAALTKLAKRKGYVLVGCADLGPNAFFVRFDAMKGALAETPVKEAYRAIHLKRYTEADAAEVNGMELVPV